ncbi:MAG: DUF1697 domain-containing protein [Planctomycetota bacterium]
MSIQIALLRGINIVGRKMVPMAELRELACRLGFTGVRTLLQSGNLVLEGGRLSGAALERRLEQQTARRLCVDCDCVVRSAAEWQQIVARNPFPQEAQDDPGHLLVMLLKATPSKDNLAALRNSIKGPEYLHADGKQLYIVYPDGVGRSKLTSNLIERKLTTRGTARNWNTVLKLAALCR